jgi:transcriptional regulator with XRE-family HTH domain
MTTLEGPTVRRKRLRTELRRVREAANLTQEQVASSMDWSLSKVIRIENGAVGISTNDLKALLELYGITAADRVADLVALAQSARQRERAWWSGFRGLISNAYLTYIGYEAEAVVISYFNGALVPGLFQTEAYMRAIMQDSPLTPLDPQVIETLVRIRLSRQRHVLDGPTPPASTLVLDEAALRRVVGSPTVMRDQLRHLQQLAKQPRFALQVLPFAAGIHPGINGPFAIFEFADVKDTDVVSLDGGPAMVFLREEEDHVVQYRDVLARLRELCLDPRDSLDLVGRIAEEI